MEQQELLEAGTTVDTLEWLRENGRVQVENHGGARYVVGNGHAKRLVDDYPLPDHVKFSTLAALLTYANRLGEKDLALEVTSYNLVTLTGPRNPHGRVPVYAKAEAHRPGLPEDWQRPLDLAYLVGRHVMDDGDRDALIKILSDVRMEDATIQRTEGLSVKVTAERKLSGKGFHEVVTPYFKLRPRRTFAEVQQPMSAYLFEAKVQDGSPAIRLTCADGGDWELDATNNIGWWLKSQAEDHGIDVTVIH